MTAPLPARRDPSAPTALRGGLEALAELDPHYDVDAGAHRFEATLAALPGPSTGVAWLKLVTVVVLVGAGVAVAVFTGGRSDDAPPGTAAIAPPARAAVNRDVAPEPVAVMDRSRTERTIPPPAVVDAPSQRSPSESRVQTPAVRVAPRPRGVVPPPPEATSEVTPPPDPLLAEMQHLNAARKHVAANRSEAALDSIAAARALEIPRHFDEEWDALEILALAGAGRLEPARRLATPFLTRHVGGRFNASIERACGLGETPLAIDP